MFVQILRMLFDSLTNRNELGISINKLPAFKADVSINREGPCSLVPPKMFPEFPCFLKAFFDFSVPCSVKYAFVPVLPALFSFCSHVSIKFIAMFPFSLKPLGAYLPSVRFHQFPSHTKELVLKCRSVY